jgi:hypothetical protein
MLLSGMIINFTFISQLMFFGHIFFILLLYKINTMKKERTPTNFPYCFLNVLIDLSTLLTIVFFTICNIINTNLEPL